MDLVIAFWVFIYLAVLYLAIFVYIAVKSQFDKLIMAGYWLVGVPTAVWFVFDLEDWWWVYWHYILVVVIILAKLYWHRRAEEKVKVQRANSKSG